MKQTHDNGRAGQSDSGAITAASRATIASNLIATRAYEIAQLPDAETDEENWLRAERELAEVAAKGI